MLRIIFTVMIVICLAAFCILSVPYLLSLTALGFGMRFLITILWLAFLIGVLVALQFGD